MSVSNDLFQVAGFFERYQQTGGVMSADEAKFMVAKLGALAEGVRALELAHKGVCDEFDRYVETSGAPVDKRPVRLFSLVGRS